MSGELSFEDVRENPKIDLHRHLLGCTRVATARDLAERNKVTYRLGLHTTEEFEGALVHRKPVSDLRAYIRPWEVLRQVVQSPDDVKRIAKESAIDARYDGIRYVEFRSSPTGLSIINGTAPQMRIPADEYFDAVRAGFSEVGGIVSRVVSSVPRHFVGLADPVAKQQYAAGFLDVIARFRDLVVGVDLTGIESESSAGLFKELFTEARKMDLPVTIHAGETEGPDQIWAAIEQLGASRIGHGWSAPEDEKLVRALTEREVVLEVCPTSSWLTGNAVDKHKHAVINCVPKIPYVICTDNPTINACTLSGELLMAARIAGVDTGQFLRDQYRRARQAAFAPAAVMSAVESLEAR